MTMQAVIAAALIIIAPKMLDVRTGEIVKNRAVVIRDGRIAEVVDATRFNPKEAMSLPANVTLMPGLIDAHTHLAWEGSPNEHAAKATLNAGFTTVRNPGATGNADVVLRKAIEEGRTPGPRMLIARAGIGSKGGICEQTFGEAGVSTPDEGRQRVRKLIADGADFIKICTGGGVIATMKEAEATEMPQDVINAIVDEAHKAKRKVAAHAQGPGAIKAAANAGVDSIEHGGLIDEDSARLLAQKHIVLVPTLARIPAGKVRDNTFARVRKARELGVPIVLGTDGTVLPHGENAKELDALREIGLTPIEAIRAATIDAAKLLNVKAGVIEPGADADLIAVANDPLSATPLDVKLVIARGKVVRNDL